jgi:hypothetical protein
MRISLKTFSYLNLDSSDIVKEITWIIGEHENLFKKYFEQVRFGNLKKYVVKKTIDKTVYCEFKRVFNKEHYAEELNVRFIKLEYIRLVEFGNLRLLKWVRSKKFANSNNWDEYTYVTGLAAHHGHFELLKWAHDNGCPLDEFTTASAAENGTPFILKY